ncbi:hypothetical protein AB0G35_04275 [Streptomyces sp. NPDC021749]
MSEAAERPDGGGTTGTRQRPIGLDGTGAEAMAWSSVFRNE